MSSRDPFRRNARRPVEAIPEDVEVTLMFCDVVRSTELTRRLGDRGAYRVIRGFHDVVLQAASQAHGEELELRGDGVLLAFEAPRRALSCAIEIQRGLVELPDSRRVHARIGVHTGSALRIATGYFGGTVILSARIAEEAAPGEILISSAVAKAAVSDSLVLAAGRWVSLKGVPEPSLVFALPWRSWQSPVGEPSCPSAAHEALIHTLERVRESAATGETPSGMLARRTVV